ncbi:uncharacterized protein VDAG_07932 [Verticillium dahliae VdLs.17]|uniref:Uncharacterized protein n=1 Tax=Verticillium dahliae (strain VdLs.17 / ATCC MYA-4575 / FGSC 10137) TaxID=498257 RepID=G2XCQ0_VERDV|nr:uncharacterized protein VDAG_07932 [Verticillium dahliae VdLs.17]EGY16768.1 hypothetical protein VDAG_07932 [Verticillium dahliae VdLs.17]KAH6706862.1 hypothetical protein EV126DRAFT_488180 [Verticillium dahliae]
MPDMTGTDLHCQYRGLFASIGERRGSAQTMVTSGLAGGMWATGSQSKVPDVLLQRTGPRLNSKSHRWCDGQAGKLASWVGDWSVPMRLAATTCTSQPSGRSKYRKAMEEGLEGKGQWACGSTTEGRAAIHCAIATLAGKEVPVSPSSQGASLSARPPAAKNPAATSTAPLPQSNGLGQQHARHRDESPTFLKLTWSLFPPQMSTPSHR